MKRLYKTSFIAFAVIGLTACASTPDPAEVCSAEWIAPRTSSAVAKIEKRASSAMKSLVKAAKIRATGDDLNFLEGMSFYRSMSKLRNELTKGQGIKDLKTVATTCNDPTIVSDAMKSLMQSQGISDSLLRRIENNPIYQSVISVITEPEPVNPNG